MGGDLSKFTDFVLERSALEWIGALVVALVLSVALMAAFTACGRKAKDSSTVLVVLALVGNLVGMTIAACYLGLKERAPERAQTRPAVMSPDAMADFVIDGMASRIVMAADVDKNGCLSPEEASAAAERFIRLIDAEEQKPVDMRVLGAALKRRIKPPGIHQGGRAGAMSPDLDAGPDVTR
jgi:hypothetical protein